MHDDRAVANDLLRRAAPADFTPVQLQTLVYFAHAGLLAIHHRPLVRQEYQAWRFGPVLPDLYDSVRQHGANTVPYAIPGFDCPKYDADCSPDSHWPAQAGMVAELCHEMTQFGPNYHREMVRKEYERM